MNRRLTVEEMLVPGGGRDLCRTIRDRKSVESENRWFIYALLSSISSAIRERADDQCRSTDRGAISSASAVSAVVRPAK